MTVMVKCRFCKTEWELLSYFGVEPEKMVCTECYTELMKVIKECKDELHEEIRDFFKNLFR